MYNSLQVRTVTSQAPLSMAILQARILEWVAKPSCRKLYIHIHTYIYVCIPTKVCLVKVMVFPVVMYGCVSWPIKKPEH